MARIRQSKGASGSTIATATFSADSSGRWDVSFVRVKSDLATSVLKFLQGATVIGTVSVGAATLVLPNAGSGPVFAGASEGAITITVDGTSACEIFATASLDEDGAV